MFYKYPVMGLNDSQAKYIDMANNYFEAGIFQFENVRCELCSSNRRRVLFKNDRYGLQYRTVICSDCGLIYTSPRFTERSNAEFYTSDVYRHIYDGDNLIEAYEKKYNKAKKHIYEPIQGNYRYRIFNVIDFLVESDIDFTTVCDIGAGGGTNLVPLMSMGKKCIGYEYSKQLAEFGKQKGINLVQGGLEDISEGSYDLIMLIHVLEHFLRPVEQLRHIARFSKRYLIVEVPSISTIVPSIQNAHQFYFSSNTLLKIASMAGFKCLKYVVFKENNFMIALFEKDENPFYSYDYEEELKESLSIINKFKIRHVICDLLKKMRLYNVSKRVYLKFKN